MVLVAVDEIAGGWADLHQIRGIPRPAQRHRRLVEEEVDVERLVGLPRPALRPARRPGQPGRSVRRVLARPPNPPPLEVPRSAQASAAQRAPGEPNSHVSGFDEKRCNPSRGDTVLRRTPNATLCDRRRRGGAERATRTSEELNHLALCDARRAMTFAEFTKRLLFGTRDRIAGTVYGTIVVMGAITAGSGARAEPSHLAAIVFATVLVLWISHVRARPRRERRPRASARPRGVASVARRELGLLLAAVGPVLALLLGAIGVVRESRALWLAMALGVATLAVQGVRYARLEHIGRLGGGACRLGQRPPAALLGRSQARSSVTDLSTTSTRPSRLTIVTVSPVPAPSTHRASHRSPSTTT